MNFYSDEDVAGWSVSEKLDGVFARLGTTGLFSRDWVLIQAPESLTQGMDPCEGEIWHKDGLERVQGCRQWAKDDIRWAGVSFHPHHLIPARRVAGIAQMEAFYNEVLERGGEGIVLRSPSGEMLKLKPSRDDEAEVIGYTQGTGRNPGIGSLVLLWGEIKFKLSVGLSNQNRINPPPVGSLITFSFDCLTAHGVPRSARFMRVRIAA